MQVKDKYLLGDSGVITGGGMVAMPVGMLARYGYEQGSLPGVSQTGLLPSGRVLRILELLSEDATPNTISQTILHQHGMLLTLQDRQRDIERGLTHFGAVTRPQAIAMAIESRAISIALRLRPRKSAPYGLRGFLQALRSGKDEASLEETRPGVEAACSFFNTRSLEALSRRAYEWGFLRLPHESPGTARIGFVLLNKSVGSLSDTQRAAIRGRAMGLTIAEVGVAQGEAENTTKGRLSYAYTALKVSNAASALTKEILLGNLMLSREEMHYVPLTDVEQEVMAYAACGYTNKAMGRPENTVRQITARAYRKLGVPLLGHSARQVAIRRLFECGVFVPARQWDRPTIT